MSTVIWRLPRISHEGRICPQSCLDYYVTFFCDNGYAILEIQKECAWTVRDVGCQKSSLASKITQTDYPDLGAHECLERAVNASNVNVTRMQDSEINVHRWSCQNRECRDLSSKKWKHTSVLVKNIWNKCPPSTQGQTRDKRIWYFCRYWSEPPPPSS